ncbi:MAG: hypothetical protein GY769_00625 [bacterium]|nr:hypothetical protein [bacterium]
MKRIHVSASLVALLALAAVMGGGQAGEAGQGAASLQGAEIHERIERKAGRARANPRPFDAPDQALAYYRAKRLGSSVRPDGSAGFDSVRAYRLAEEQVARMPRLRVSSRRPSKVAKAGSSLELEAATAWEWLGPGNIGGRTRVLAINPKRPKIMYAGGVSGGIWKSKNRGKSWQPVGDRLSNLAVNSLAMDPEDPNTLYAGTGEGYFREVVRQTSLPLRGGGIFKTTDAGATWELLRKTRKESFQWVNDLVVSPRASDRIYAATRKGVFRSTNAGRKWKRILRSKARGGCLDLVLSTANGTDTLFASCGTLEQATVLRNRRAEDSKEWREVLSEPGMGRTSLAIAPSDPDVVYALSASNVPGPGGNFEQALHAVFRSTAGGLEGTWEARLRNSGGRKIDRVVLSNPIIAFLEECGFQGTNGFFAMGWYVNLIAVDPGNADRIWVGGVDLFRSDDGGASFNPVTYWWSDPPIPNSVHADQHAVVFHPKNGRRLYALNDGGVYELRNPRVAIPSDPLAVCTPGSNGGDWKSLNRNYGVTQFYHGTATPDARRFIAGAQDNGTVLGDESFGANGWVTISGGDGGYSAIHPGDNRIIYVTSQNGRVRKSIDGGASFSEAIDGISDLETNNTASFRAVGPNFLFISPLVMDPNQPQRLWLGGRRLWRTDDGALGWRAASAPLSSAGKVSAVAVAPGRSDLVIVGTDNGWIHTNDQATLAGSTDDWPGTRLRSGFVSSIAFDPENLDIVYATYATFNGEHVWKSEDAGMTWSALDGSGAGALPDLPVHSIVVDPAESGQIFLGTDLGVFASADGGSTWGVEASGLPPAVTEWISYIETPGGARYLFAFTHGRGAWRLRLDD